jgi:hypothetical protein
MYVMMQKIKLAYYCSTKGREKGSLLFFTVQAGLYLF